MKNYLWPGVGSKYFMEEVNQSHSSKTGRFYMGGEIPRGILKQVDGKSESQVVGLCMACSGFSRETSVAKTEIYTKK